MGRFKRNQKKIKDSYRLSSMYVNPKTNIPYTVDYDPVWDRFKDGNWFSGSRTTGRMNQFIHTLALQLKNCPTLDMMIAGGNIEEIVDRLKAIGTEVVTKPVYNRSEEGPTSQWDAFGNKKPRRLIGHRIKLKEA